MPLDVETIVASVRKTHRLLVVDEAWAMCGIGAEIAQAINELAFDELDAPVGPAAYRSDLASLRAGAGTRDAGRRRRASSTARREVIAGVRAGARPLARAGPRAARTGGRPPRRRAEARRAGAAAAARWPATRVEITMPFGDLTVSEGKVVGWLKAVGDAVAAGELVAEIETDKAVVEIEAPGRGHARRDRRAGRRGGADGRPHRTRPAHSGGLTGAGGTGNNDVDRGEDGGRARRARPMAEEETPC